MLPGSVWTERVDDDRMNVHCNSTLETWYLMSPLQLDPGDVVLDDDRMNVHCNSTLETWYFTSPLQVHPGDVVLHESTASPP